MEDLQFQIEEEAISKDDLEVIFYSVIFFLFVQYLALYFSVVFCVFHNFIIVKDRSRRGKVKISGKRLEERKR